MHDVQLAIGSELYSGWKEIRVSRSMEQVCASFSLSVTERWPGTLRARPLAPGMPCQIRVDGKDVITGYIDEVEIDYDAESHSMTVSGRSKTADLVDCSAPSTQWRDRTLLQVAQAVCKPYGIKVLAEIEQDDWIAPFQKLKANEGESVFSFLESAARIRGVLLLSNEAGDLVITRAGTRQANTALVFGDNCWRGNAQYNHAERYSAITVKGQSADGDLLSAAGVGQPLAMVRDTRVSRFRPLTIVAEKQITAADARRRAEWERNVRFGRSQHLRYMLNSWSQRDGRLWAPNELVDVRDSWLGVDGARLITSVTFTLSDAGYTTELVLTQPEAFTPLKLKDPMHDGGWAP